MKFESLVPPRPALDLTVEGVRQWIRGSLWPAPSFLLNLVSDANGNFVGSTGSSRDLTNEIDFQVLLGLREIADGILTTAKTAQIEKYKRSTLAPLALVSRRGDFSGIPAVLEAQAGPVTSRVILLVPSDLVRKTKRTYSQPWVTVKGVGKGSVFRITLALTRENWRRVVVESGPEFSTWLIREFGIKYLNLSIVSTDESIEVTAANQALANLGVKGGTLETAHRIGGTLVTRWSDLFAPAAGQRRGNRVSDAGRIA